MIHEVIITTMNINGSVHIAPMGVRREGHEWIIAPFKPSTTLDNLKRHGEAVINMTDDVRIFAGCLTGRRDWRTVATEIIDGRRLAAVLSHLEVVVARCDEDEVRPVFYCHERHQQQHAPFLGLNRAKAAVLEAAVLVSRLQRLPVDKIDREIAYLQIAIDKTAGEAERQAWQWLMARITAHRAGDEG